MTFGYQQNPSHEATRTDVVVTGGFAAACGVAVLLAALWSQDTTGQLALIYPPWISGPEALARASSSGASLVALGRYPFIVIVSPGSPEQGAPLVGSGAILTLGANRFGGCLKASVSL